MTILALTCLLVVGAAAASILGRASVPGAGPATEQVSADEGPVVSNKAGKTDKLAVVTEALASFDTVLVGGGPGGLMTAYLLEHRSGRPLDFAVSTIARKASLLVICIRPSPNASR